MVDGDREAGVNREEPLSVFERRFLESWDNGRGWSFAPWLKSCGANIRKLKATGVEYLADKPSGHWVDGEWVEGAS